MERQAELGFENALNRDTNQTIFLLTFLNSMQATASQETNNYSQNASIHIHDPLSELSSQDLCGLVEIS